jgi:chemotaxis protein MotB
VKALARKKREEGGGGGNAPWLNTFADLMNLLLCFFVLLFSMSTVDAEKFEKIAISMANSIGIFDGGESSIGSGNLISSGMTQMNELDEYYTNMGKASVETGEDLDAEDNEQQEGNDTGQNTQEQGNMEGQEGSVGNGDAELDKALERIEEAMTKVSKGMYDEVSDLTEQYNIGDYVELSIDPEYRFVQLTLKGSVLFNSGKADIKEAAKPILSKIGEILLKFDGYTVEVTGHTDNVPMTNGIFKDNNWLSSARALNAAEYMIDNSNLDASKVKYSGRGEYEPIASNETEDGRAKNRRIEIKIYNEYSRD